MGTNYGENFLHLFVNVPIEFLQQMEKYAHRHNVILGIIKAHHNIVKTRPSNFNCGNINAIAMWPTHARTVQRCHHREFMILFISSSVADFPESARIQQISTFTAKMNQVSSNTQS